MSTKKLKVRRSIARRFKVTKTGKVLHGSSFTRHLRRNKSKSQIRNLKGLHPISGTVAKKIKQMLGV